MLFTPTMADAFGDWLEREQIQQALVTARPELGDRMVPDEARPLLRIPRPDGARILVAKTLAEPEATWVVGVSGPHGPRLHETDSVAALVTRVLEMLDELHLPGDSGAGPL